MREKHLLQDRIELLGPVRPGDVLSVGQPLPSFQSTNYLPQGFITRFDIYEYLSDGIVRNRHLRSSMCGALCCFYPCGRCARDIARRYDQFRGARGRWFVFLPPLSYSFSPPYIHSIFVTVSNSLYLIFTSQMSSVPSLKPYPSSVKGNMTPSRPMSG